MKKRILAFAAITMMTMSLLYGCGSDDNQIDADTEAVTETTTEVTTEAATEETEAETETEAPDEYIGDFKIVSYSNLEESEESQDVFIIGVITETYDGGIYVEDADGNDWFVWTVDEELASPYVGTKCEVYGGTFGEYDDDYKAVRIFTRGDDWHIVFDDGSDVYILEYEESKEESESNSRRGEGMVWIPTEGGTKYHSKSTCSQMENPKEVTENEAIAAGFDKCARCW